MAYEDHGRGYGFLGAVRVICDWGKLRKLTGDRQMNTTWGKVIDFNDGQLASTMKMMVAMWQAAQTVWGETMVTNLLTTPLAPSGVADQIDKAGVKVLDEVTREFLI
jgi:hypothetical protein